MSAVKEYTQWLEGKERMTDAKFKRVDGQSLSGRSYLFCGNRFSAQYVFPSNLTAK